MSRQLPFESSLYKALSKIRKRPSSRHLVVPTTEGTFSSFGNDKFTDSGKALRKTIKRGGNSLTVTVLTSKKSKKQQQQQQQQQQQLYRYHHYKKQYLLRRETRKAKKKNSNNKKESKSKYKYNSKHLQSPRIWKVADDVHMQNSWGETVVGPALNLNSHNKYDDGDDDDCECDDENGVDENGAVGIGVGVGVDIDIGDGDDDSCGESSHRCEVGQDQAARSVASPRLLPHPHPQPQPQHPPPQHETIVVDVDVDIDVDTGQAVCADHSTTLHEPQQELHHIASNGEKESPPVEQPRSFVVGELVWVLQGKTDHLATCVGIGVGIGIGKGVGSENILVQWAVNKLKQRVPLSSARAFEMDDGRRRRTRRRSKTKHQV